MMLLLFLGLMLACPILAFTFNTILNFDPVAAAKRAGYTIGAGFLIAISLLMYLALSGNSHISFPLGVSTLNLLLSSLILLVSFIVHRFSLRYLNGDRLYTRFFILLAAITLSVLLMVLADNIFLFWGSWVFSNLLLVLLMTHKKEWQASKNAGILALGIFSVGAILLFVAFVMLHFIYSTSSIELFFHQANVSPSPLLKFSLSLILIVALTQSGLFPFHKWLTSSLNSPTPVSALMHAGLINGGGILIVKFAPIMIFYPELLMILFIMGSISACLGTIWKLMQYDIKKMLACSTMAQMGFMMMQCGVGLFPAAIAHLCWHGLFKAFLFLNAGSAVKEKKSDAFPAKTSSIKMSLSFTGGAVAMIAFALVTGKSLSLIEASTFVLFFAFIAGAQLMLTWTRSHRGLLGLLFGLIIALFSGLMYGVSIYLIQSLIPELSVLQIPKLLIIHWVIMILFGFLWMIFNLGWYQRIGQSRFGCWLYMNLFNLSQPSSKTVTALRNDYKY